MTIPYIFLWDSLITYFNFANIIYNKSWMFFWSFFFCYDQLSDRSYLSEVCERFDVEYACEQGWWNTCVYQGHVFTSRIEDKSDCNRGATPFGPSLAYGE